MVVVADPVGFAACRATRGTGGAAGTTDKSDNRTVRSSASPRGRLPAPARIEPAK